MLKYLELNRGPIVTAVENMQDGFLFEEYRDIVMV